jgi:hypothetical protein
MPTTSRLMTPRADRSSAGRGGENAPAGDVSEKGS